ELSVRRAVRGLLEGAVDGVERFRGMLPGLTRSAEAFRAAAGKALLISLVEPERAKVEEILQALGEISKEPIPGLELDTERGEDAPAARPAQQPPPIDLDPAERTTLVQIARSIPPPAAAAAPPAPGRTTTLQYSALGERAAITVREVEVTSFFLRQL